MNDFKLHFKKMWFSGHECHYVLNKFHPPYKKGTTTSSSEFMCQLRDRRFKPVRKKDWFFVKCRLTQR